MVTLVITPLENRIRFDYQQGTLFRVEVLKS